MLAVPGRNKSFLLLGVVLGAQFLMLAVQIHSEQRHTRLIRVWAVGAVTPFARAGTWGIGKVRSTWNGYIGLTHTHKENQELQAEIDRLRIRNTELEGQAEEAQR